MVKGLGALYGIRLEPDRIDRSVPDRIELMEMQMADFHDGFGLIENKLTLRMPTASEKESFDEIVFGGEKLGVQLLLEADEENIIKCLDTIQRGVLALRLHKVDRMSLRFFSFEENSGSRYLILDLYGPINMITYELHYSEIENVKTILNKLYEFDPDKHLHFRIAYNRFFKSFEEKLPEDKLLELCISLEALFCQGEYLGNKGKTIGIGCSMLIGKTYSQRKTILTKIYNAFQHRNNVIHGNKYEEVKIRKILPDLEEYLRKSILSLIPE